MKSILYVCAAFLSLASVAGAQPAPEAFRQGVTPNPDRAYATMHLRTNLGSCRFIDGEGKIQMSFTGTILINKLNGTHTVTGNVTREFADKDRIVYVGTGTLTVQGSWRAVQWFGSNMRAIWYGAGIVRLAGEFDRNLRTGEVWYDDPEFRDFWPGQGTREFLLPPFLGAQPPTEAPRPRVRGGR